MRLDQPDSIRASIPAMLECIFEQGELVVRGGGEDLRLHPDGRAWSVERRGNRPVAPAFRLFARHEILRDPLRSLEPRHIDIADGLTTAAQIAKRMAYAAFRAALPEAFVKAVEPFRAHQWGLLDFLRLGSPALDLAASSPALAFALANNDLFRKGHPSWEPAKRARQQIHRRQRDILHWLGFPGTEAVANLFRKIAPAAVDECSLRLLRGIVTDPKVGRWLAHLPRPNAGVLAVVCNRNLHPLLSPGLLEDLSASEDNEALSPAADLLGDIALMWQDLHPERRPPRSRTITDACRLHDELLMAGERRREAMARAAQEEQERRREQARTARRATVRTRRRARAAASCAQNAMCLPDESFRPVSFPPPPLPGTKDIEPLTTAASLVQEGREMGNCVARYDVRVLEGHRYIYRVLRPQRATLCVLRIGKRWVCEQVRLARNGTVHDDTYRHVTAWLFAAQSEEPARRREQDRLQTRLEL